MDLCNRWTCRWLTDFFEMLRFFMNGMEGTAVEVDPFEAAESESEDLVCFCGNSNLGHWKCCFGIRWMTSRNYCMVPSQR